MEYQLTAEQQRRRTNFEGLMAAIRRREAIDLDTINPNDISIEGLHTARIVKAMVEQGRSADRIAEFKV